MKIILDGRKDGWEDRRKDGQTDRGKTVYLSPPSGGGGIKICSAQDLAENKHEFDINSPQTIRS
jgi:hypothetical protein